MTPRNLILSALLGAGITCSASAAISVVGTASANVNSGTFSLSYALQGAGNALVVGFYNDNNAAATISFDGTATTVANSISQNRTTVALLLNPPATVTITSAASATAANSGYFIYELSGVDTSAAPIFATGNSITTTADGQYVFSFLGINNVAGLDNVPAAGSVIPGANSGVVALNGGTGGGALVRGFGVAGTAGAQGVAYTPAGGASGQVSLALTAVIPEPSTLALALGGIGLAALRRRKY